MKWAHFDEMTWPLPDADLNHALRYDETVTKTERLCAASVLDAYAALIEMPERRRRPTS